MRVAIFTCPKCNHPGGVVIPEDKKLDSYQCKKCGAVIKTPPGGCCVICSYTDKKCGSEDTPMKRE